MENTNENSISRQCTLFENQLEYIFKYDKLFKEWYFYSKNNQNGEPYTLYEHFKNIRDDGVLQLSIEATQLKMKMKHNGWDETYYREEPIRIKDEMQAKLRALGHRTTPLILLQANDYSILKDYDIKSDYGEAIETKTRFLQCISADINTFLFPSV